MLRGISFKKGAAPKLVFTLCAALVCSSSFADQLSDGELLKAYRRELAAENYGEAIGYMHEYLAVTVESTTPRVMEIAQDVRMQLAHALIEINSLDEAALVLQEYVDKTPCKFPRYASKLLSTTYLRSPNYEACIAATTNALALAEASDEEEEEVVVEKRSKTRKEKDEEELDREDALKEDIIEDIVYSAEDIELLHKN